MPNNARKVTLDNLDKFGPLLGGGSEKENEENEAEKEVTALDEANVDIEGDSALKEALALFGAKNAKVKLPFAPAKYGAKPTSKPIREPGIQAPLVNQPVAVTPNPLAKGNLLYQRKLDRTSAQRQTGHPTGDCRLTTHGFRVNGQLIDRTTYFRNTVFGQLNWKVEKKKPYVEVGEASFHVVILGKDYGTRKLMVGHKPSGEAGQGNYTTSIRWGSLDATLRNQVDVTGKTMRLYGPTQPGADFLMEIV